MNVTTRSTLLGAAAMLALTMGVPGQAAPADAVQADTITFEQYRDWRLHFIDERQTQIAAELAAGNLASARRTALERQKTYFDFFATMPQAERDRRFRERFDQIDANHDGVIDQRERAAWHDKQQAFYSRPGAGARQAAAGDVRHP